MNRHARISNGLGRIRVHFLEKLPERRRLILQHALAAAEAQTTDAQMTELMAARGVLHQIAGTAGTLGFVQLGAAARAIEVRIDNFDPNEDTTPLLEELLGFADDCETILADQ